MGGAARRRAEKDFPQRLVAQAWLAFCHQQLAPRAWTGINTAYISQQCPDNVVAVSGHLPVDDSRLAMLGTSGFPANVINDVTGCSRLLQGELN